MLFRNLILKSASLPPIKKFVKNSKLFRPVVNRFIAGETLDASITTAENLVEQGYNVSLDLLGENVATVEEANASTQNYIDLLEKITQSPHKDKINISIKLTALGLDQSLELAEENYRKLLEAAKPANIFIRADMEGSPYTQTTIDLVRKVRIQFPNTGTVLQSALHRTDGDLETLLADYCRLRIVKGAYLEPAEIAYPDKKQVDQKYIEQAKKLMLRGHYPAIASHDEAIINLLKKFASDKSVNPQSFEWQMLHGIRRDLQAQLKDEGYNVRIYLPFGEAWYPYFTRRLAERPANVLFILRSLFQK
jgi:proline dehydrogenase